MRRLLPLAVLLPVALPLALPTGASAHEMRPAILDLEADGDATLVTLRWRPVRGGRRPTLELPDHCEGELLEAGDGLRRWRLPCASAELLLGARLALDPFTPDAVVRVHDADGVATRALGPDSPRLGEPNGAPPGFVVLGVEHILLGPDHLLFVLGLLLLVLAGRAGTTVPVRRLALAVTAFTVAHSVTLGLALSGLVDLPTGGVEAAIALSLVLVAREILRDADSLTRRHPERVAFAFGLLHGFGFASALGEVGLPRGELFSALLAFNLGVELGQLAFLAGCLGALLAARRWAPRAPLSRVAAYGIGTAGAFWSLERTLVIATAGGFS